MTNKVTLPEKVLKFCPKCGGQHFSKQKSYSFLCQNCNFKYYINAASAVTSIIKNFKNEILFVIRKNNPGKGLFDLPGGFVDVGEKAEDAIVREIKEELNLDVLHVQYFTSAPNTYEFHGLTYFTLDLAFICEVENFSNIKALDDASGYRFVALENINYDEIAFKSVKNILEQYL